MGRGSYGFTRQGEQNVALFKAGLLRGTTVLYSADDRATPTLVLDQPYAEPTPLIRGAITHPIPKQIQQAESTGLIIVSHPEDHSNLIIPVEIAGGLFGPFLPVEILDEQRWPFALTHVSEGQAVSGLFLRRIGVRRCQVVNIMVPRVH